MIPQIRLLESEFGSRIDWWHNLPEAYAALRTGMEDRKAEVRWQTTDLLLSAYLDARREVPPEIVAKLEQMVDNDSDAEV